MYTIYDCGRTNSSRSKKLHIRLDVLNIKYTYIETTTIINTKITPFNIKESVYTYN